MNDLYDKLVGNIGFSQDHWEGRPEGKPFFAQLQFEGGKKSGQLASAPPPADARPGHSPQPLTARPFMQPQYRDGREYVQLPTDLHKAGEPNGVQSFMWTATRVLGALHDLQNDPDQTKNLVNDPAYH